MLCEFIQSNTSNLIYIFGYSKDKIGIIYKNINFEPFNFIQVKIRLEINNKILFKKFEANPKRGLLTKILNFIKRESMIHQSIWCINKFNSVDFILYLFQKI